MAREEDLERTELEAVLETRRELGPTYDRALVDSFADRIETALEQRVDARLQHQRSSARAAGGGQVRQFVLGIISLGAGIRSRSCRWW